MIIHKILDFVFDMSCKIFTVLKVIIRETEKFILCFLLFIKEFVSLIYRFIKNIFDTVLTEITPFIMQFIIDSLHFLALIVLTLFYEFLQLTSVFFMFLSRISIVISREALEYAFSLSQKLKRL